MFVERLKALCKERGISFVQFERESGLGEHSVYRWDTNSPSYKKVKTAADYFGITVSELTGETEKPAPNNGDGLDHEISAFRHSLPAEKLRGILVALDSPSELLSELDQQELHK